MELGDNDSVAGQLFMAATSGFTYGMINNSVGGSFNADGKDNSKVRSYIALPDSSDNTKITYMTPSFEGFTAGVSYAPEANVGYKFEDADIQDQTGVGLSYSGDFDDVGLKSSLFGTYEDNAGKDVTGVQGAVQVSFSGFTVGLAANQIDKEDTSRENAVQFGVSYSTGPFIVSSGALYSEYKPDNSSTDADEEMAAVSAGVAYRVMPGVYAGLGGTYGEYKVDGGDDGKFNTVVAGVSVSF